MHEWRINKETLEMGIANVCLPIGEPWVPVLPSLVDEAIKAWPYFKPIYSQEGDMLIAIVPVSKPTEGEILEQALCE